MVMLLNKQIKLLTAWTGYVQVKSGNTTVEFNNYNNWNLVLDFYEERINNNFQNQSSNLIIKSCALYSGRERQFLINYFFSNNITKFYITPETGYDYFDALFFDEKTKKKKMIEVKFRDKLHTDFTTDLLMKDKYDNLFYEKKYYGIDEVYYINIFKDYHYRSYRLNNLELDFSFETKIEKNKGINKEIKKTVMNAELDKSMIYKSGKIIFI